MKKRRILMVGGSLLLTAFAACEPYLSREDALDGKACPCATGYTCLVDKCVPDSDERVRVGSVLPPRGADGGAAGTGAAAVPEGNAGADSSMEGSAGGGTGEPEPEPTPTAGAGGAPGSAGSGALPDAGSVEPAPPDAGCANPVPLFRDRDGDGFGGEAVEDGCPADGLVTVGGDCLDATPSQEPLAFFVRPTQTAFFAEGYPSAANPSGVSFDYDCDGEETADPALAAQTEIPDCSQLMICAPGASNGYRPTERAGASESPLCGSVNFVFCQPVADGSCEASEAVRANAPFRCK